ncbi:unnamed protein product [Ilex paraguariensis]|uniref:Protein kinase domain-containing protein n=1 Tax=Ilex paraguariensis TaxID=185542 RepID=A0ABC8U6M0_9AQUA
MEPLLLRRFGEVIRLRLREKRQDMGEVTERDRLEKLCSGLGWPSNVLLDRELVSHVCDFGIARFLLTPTTQNVSISSTSSTGARGSTGYAAPGKRPTDNMFRDGLNLHNYVVAALPDRVAEIMDPILVEEFKEEEEITSSANSSTQTRRHQRLSCRIQKDHH